MDTGFTMLNRPLQPLAVALLAVFSLSSCGSTEGRIEDGTTQPAQKLSPTNLTNPSKTVVQPKVEEPFVPKPKPSRLAKANIDAPESILAQQPARAFKTSFGKNLGPAAMCEGSVTHAERVNIPAVAKPPFMKYYKDPAFGSRMIRISNGAFGDVFKPPYSTMQAWNADESLILLYRSGNGNAYHLLLDGHTYQPVKKLPILPSDLEEIFWSHSDPDIFFYVSKRSTHYGHFVKYNVRTDKITRIAHFPELCGERGLPTSGKDVQMQSIDDDLFGFRCRLPKSDDYIMFSYRISTDKYNMQKIGKGTKWRPWTAPMPGPSGKRFWYQGTTLNLDMETVEIKHDMYKYGEHANIGRTYNGQDAIFQTVFDPSPNGCNGDLWKGIGHLVEHNLETGVCRPIISEAQGYPYTTGSTHVSAQAYHRPGWVAMSSIGHKEQFEFFTNKRKAPALLSEIYLADTHPQTGKTCRLAHHRSYGKNATQGGYPSYFGEPHATISPSGTRILFGSDWYDSGSVDSFIIELPGYKKP